MASPAAASAAVVVSPVRNAGSTTSSTIRPSTHAEATVITP